MQQTQEITKKNKDGNFVKLTFKDLKYEVTVPYSKEDAKKFNAKTYNHTIIKNVSGYAMPG